MSVNRCEYLISEYVGRYHAVFCRCDNPGKYCPRKYKQTKGKVQVSCFNLTRLGNKELAEKLTSAGTYGTGEPTVAVTKPLEMLTP